nr:hypothetical protein [Tanacetum cinerariifolium]
MEEQKDEDQIVIRNKARLVAKGYAQEEGIDFEESFALVARLEAVQIFVAYVAHKESLLSKKSSILIEASSKSLAKKESSDEDSSYSNSGVEEYAMVVKEFKKFFKRQRRSSHRRMSKSPRSNNQRAFIGGSWSDSGEDEEEKAKDETCLVAQALNEICLGINLEPNEWIEDSGCSKHMTGKRKLFSSYKAYNGENIIFGSNLRGNIIGKVDESLNVTFDETPSLPKTSSLKDDDLLKEEAIEGSGIETIVYTDSDHAGDYVDRNGTSGICTFMGCCLTSWFSKKETTFAISATEAEYVSVRKACHFGVDAVEDFKEYMPRDHYCWLKTYCCLAKKNELKARGNLLMALPDKHQLKFNIHKDAKSLMEAIEKRFGGNKEIKKVQKTLLKQQYENFTRSSSESLDQVHDRLQKLISQLEILRESLSQEDVNLKLLRSLPAEWRTHTLIWRNKTDLEDQNLEDLFNSLKIYEAEVKGSSSTSPTAQSIAFVSSQNTNNTNEPVSVVISVSATSIKVHVSALPNVDTLSDAIIYSFFASQSNSPQLDNDDFKQIDTGRNLGANGTTSIWFDMSKVECYNCHWRGHFARKYNALVDLRKKFKKAEQERDELKLKLDKFQTSSNNLSLLLASQTSDKTRLGHDNHVFNSTVFDYDEMFSFEFNVSMPTSLVYDRFKLGEGYHAVPPPYTGTFMPPKPDLVFHDAHTINETVPTDLSVEPSPTKPDIDLPSVKPNEHTIPAKNLRKDIPKSRVHRHSWNRKACFVCKILTYLIKDCDYNEQKMVLQPNALKDKGVIDSGCSRHMTGNISYLSDFEEISRGYVAFGGNLKGGKITDTKRIILSYGFKLPDDNHVLLRVPRENNMYNVDLKNIVPIGDLTCLFSKATLDESNLWHIRLGHINFKTMNKLVKDSLLPFPFRLRQLVLPAMSEIRCPVTILNTLDPLGKFDGKADEGFLVGYSVSSKAFRVFNSRTRIVQDTLHLNFLENQPNVAGSRPTWLFDINTLTHSMNYQPVVAGNKPNSSAGIEDNFDAGKIRKEPVSTQKYVLLHLWSTGSKDPQNLDADAAFTDKENKSEVHVSPSSSDKPNKHDDKAKREAKGKNLVDVSIGVRDLSDEFKEFSVNSTNRVNAASTTVTVVGLNSTNSTNNFNVVGPSNTAVSLTFKIGGKSSFVDPSQYLDDPDMPALEDIIYSDDEEDVSVKADFSNLETNITVSPIPTTRVHKDHPVTQIIDLPKGKRAIGSKWVFRNKKDERGIFIRNKARLVAQGHTQEEGIDYEEVFALAAKIEAILLFLAYASSMGFMVYQMDVKSAFLYGTIKEEVYVCQPIGFEDPYYPDKVYKVVKPLYGLHQAPRAWLLVTKPNNKTPYKLLLGRTPSKGFMRPFGCPVTILNPLDPLGKFDRKADEGFLVGYSVSSKAFRVFNSRTRIVQETLHINFLENQPNVVGSGPTWLFDIDTLTQSINYQPVLASNQPNPSAGIQEHFDADKAGEGNVQQYVLFPLWFSGSKDPQMTDADTTFEVKDPESEVHVFLSSGKTQREDKGKSHVKLSTGVRNLSEEFEDFLITALIELMLPVLQKSSYMDPSQYHDDPDMPALEDITYSADEEDVWVLVDLPKGKRAIGSKWVFRNKMDERGIVIRNKARLVAQGHTQEEVIDYKQVFAPVARIEAIRLSLAYASFMGFMVNQMDVKSAFLYRTIEEEVYVCQPLRFEDPDYPDKVYVDDIIFGIANKDLCKAFEKLMKDKFQMSSMGEHIFFLGLQVKEKPDGIFISQDKYVAKVLKKFGLTNRKSASTPIDINKPLLKDPDVKRIFRYLKGKPHLGLWYPKDSPFNLVAYSNSDYAGASLDRKSTTGTDTHNMIAYLTKSNTSEGFEQIIDFLNASMIQYALTRTAWNEFSSSKASTVICLATGRKFNFSKYIFDSLVRNVDSSYKFYMYPRFLQLMINAQIADLTSHNTKYTSPALTQKVFPNMRRVGKGFSGVDTQLFEGMLVPQVQDDINASDDVAYDVDDVANVANNKIAQALEITKLKQRVRRLEKKKKLKASGLRRWKKGKIAEIDADEDVTLEEVAAEVPKDAEAEPAKHKEVIKVVNTAKLMIDVVTAAAATIVAAPSTARRRKGVVIRDPKKTATSSVIVHFEPNSKDKGKGILVEEPKPLKI